MNNILKYTLLALVLLQSICCSGSAWGQNYTKRIPIPYDEFHLQKMDSAIIRKIDNQRSLAYFSYHSEINGCFYLIDDNDSTVHTIPLYSYETQLNELQVRDMEIRDSVVYFCGKYGLDDDAIGMFGFFSLIDFPYSPITVVLLNSFHCINKMDLFLVPRPETLHAPMIGIDQEGGHQIIDAELQNSYAKITCSGTNVKYTLFDDIIVDDTSVVVSARNTALNRGYILSFPLPITNSGSSLLSQTCRELELGEEVPSKIVLGNRGYFASASSSNQITFSNYITTTSPALNKLTFQNFDMIDIRKIHATPFFYTIKVEILWHSIAYDLSAFTCSHFTTTHGSGSYYDYQYFDENITSSDYNGTGLGGSHIAAGVGWIDEVPNPSIYRVSTISKESCAEIIKSNLRTTLSFNKLQNVFFHPTVLIERYTPMDYPMEEEKIYIECIHSSTNNFIEDFPIDE